MRKRTIESIFQNFEVAACHARDEDEKCRVNSFFVYSRTVCGGQSVACGPGFREVRDWSRVAWDRERDTCRQRRVINRTRKCSRRCAMEIMILRHVRLELEPFVMEGFRLMNSLTPFYVECFTVCKVPIRLMFLEMLLKFGGEMYT